MAGTLVLNAKLNGPNLSTVFTDSTTLHTLTSDGSEISTTQSKFGGSSALGAGVLIDQIGVSLQLPGDCSGGCWYYIQDFTALTSMVFLFLGSDTIVPPNPEKFAVGVDNTSGISASSKLVIQVGDTSLPHSFVDVAVGASGVWHYMEWWRASGQFYVSVDGVKTNNPWANAGTLSNPTTDIGGIAYTSGGVVYFDDAWVVKGEAVHTADFTPPTEEFVYPLAPPPPTVDPSMKTFINRLSCTVGNAPGIAGDILTVGAAVASYRSFNASHDGAILDVTITEGNAWEVRTNCVYTHATTTLSRGTLVDSSTGSAISLTSSAIVTATPHATAFAGIENEAVRVPLASASPATNYTNITAAITEAGVNGKIIFPPAQTYLLARDIQPLSGQTLIFNQSVLKLPNQVSTTTTAGVGVTTVATPNPTAVFNVASSASFFVGQGVVLDDATVGGVRTFSVARGVVTVVAAGQVTVQFTAGAGTNLVVTSNTGTFIETYATNYTFPTGTTLCSLSPLLTAAVGHSRIRLVDLSIDGNRANNTLGLRWETSPMVDFRSGHSSIENLYIYDAPTDGLYFAAANTSVTDLRVLRSGAMNVHLGAASSIGAQQSTLERLWLDSPGLGSALIGHYGGISNSFPAYPALGFSRLTDHLIIRSVHITNSMGTLATIGQAIGCVTGSDNFALDFSNVFISGFNKGRGAIQISSVTGAGVPSRIDFSGLHMESCGPITPGTFNAYEVSLIGNTAGAPPFADRVTFRNCDFTDSPLAIRAANVAVENVNFVATAVANTATLIMLAGGASQGRVDLSGVRSSRPTGNGAGAPGANEYATCLLANGVTVRGDDISCIGGHLGWRVQNAADVEVSNLRCENNFNYGVMAMDGSTRLVLRSPRVRVTSGTTVQTPYAGIDLNSGGGALGALGYCSITAPDIDIVTTVANQYGIRLAPTAAVPCAVVGGKVKVSGTSTTPILSGGASGVGVVAGVALSHTFTPGAAEVSSNNVVSVNL